MNRDLYLYEVVDIIGQGQYDYMEHLWQDPVLRMPEMFGLQGAFYILGSGGGRWPQVVNIWDVGSDGWKRQAKNLDRLNLKRRKAFYGDWWDKAAQWRTGGFDRLCGGVPGSPSTSEIAEAGITGTLFLNEILTVRPGTPLEFLAAVVQERVPLMADYVTGGDTHLMTPLPRTVYGPDDWEDASLENLPAAQEQDEK